MTRNSAVSDEAATFVCREKIRQFFAEEPVVAPNLGPVLDGLAPIMPQLRAGERWAIFIRVMLDNDGENAVSFIEAYLRRVRADDPKQLPPRPRQSYTMVLRLCPLIEAIERSTAVH